MMSRFGKMHCSFCGESEHTVTRLIAGPRVFICEGCVDKCIGILGSKPEWCDQQIARLTQMRTQPAG
jgi:ATP-dependent protease Clp ATPase subunit